MILRMVFIVLLSYCPTGLGRRLGPRSLLAVPYYSPTAFFVCQRVEVYCGEPPGGEPVVICVGQFEDDTSQIKDAEAPDGYCKLKSVESDTAHQSLYVAVMLISPALRTTEL